MTTAIFLSSFLGTLFATLLLTISRHQWKKNTALRWASRAIATTLYMVSFAVLSLQFSATQTVFVWLGMLGFGSVPAVFLFPLMTQQESTR